ncbi:MAG TPA: glycosyltransferase [Thermoleophilaceae bacterium]|nr:glycosyltransferase [Thermoleophilaceae bacterium]
MIFVVIPCLDERDNLPGLFEGLRRHTGLREARVVFVDDGSSDGSGRLAGELAEDVPLTLLTHERNRGLGAAVASGLQVALREGGDDDVVVTVESDNTADLGDLPRLVECLEAGADVAMASYLAPGGRVVGVARWRVAASQAVTGLFRLAGGLREFHQVTPLYRAYRVSAIRRVAEVHGEGLITETGFAVNVELLLKLRQAGARVDEIPTTLDWTRRRGHSKLPLASTVRAYLRLLLVARTPPRVVHPSPARAER